jgi:hypothetical protein
VFAVPTTFQDGQVLKTADLNSNFGDLETRVAALEAFKSSVTKGGTYSVGSTICGLTDKTSYSVATRGFRVHEIGHAVRRSSQALRLGRPAPPRHAVDTLDSFGRDRPLDGVEDAHVCQPFLP